MASFLLTGLALVGGAALAVFLLACVCDSASEMITGHRRSNVEHGFEVTLKTEENPVVEAPAVMKEEIESGRAE